MPAASGGHKLGRIYLGRGVYADLALIFRNQQFQPVPWTYPDYPSPEMLALLGHMRQRLLESLKCPRANDL